MCVCVCVCVCMCVCVCVARAHTYMCACIHHCVCMFISHSSCCQEIVHNTSDTDHRIDCQLIGSVTVMFIHNMFSVYQCIYIHTANHASYVFEFLCTNRTLHYIIHYRSITSLNSENVIKKTMKNLDCCDRQYLGITHCNLQPLYVQYICTYMCIPAVSSLNSPNVDHADCCGHMACMCEL